MENIENADFEIVNKISDEIRELNEKVQKMFTKGLITKEEHDELLEFNIFEYAELSSTDAFKVAFTKRRPIKCSELILEIFYQHKNNFRKAIMLSDLIIKLKVKVIFFVDP